MAMEEWAPEQMDDQQVREAVRERYAASATSLLTAQPQSGCCGGGGCCGSSATAVDPISSDLYVGTQAPSETALAASLGCGGCG